MTFGMMLIALILAHPFITLLVITIIGIVLMLPEILEELL